jgi:hypothetical protein
MLACVFLCLRQHPEHLLFGFFAKNNFWEGINKTKQTAINSDHNLSKNVCLEMVRPVVQWTIMSQKISPYLYQYLPPRIRSIDLFRHRRVAIVF